MLSGSFGVHSSDSGSTESTHSTNLMNDLFDWRNKPLVEQNRRTKCIHAENAAIIKHLDDL